MADLKYSGHNKDLIKDRIRPILDILPRIAKGDLSKRLDTTIEDDEFTDLYNEMNNMLKGLNHIFKEHKVATKALNESVQKYKMLFENVNEGILHLDMKGIIQDANPKLLEILGCELEEVAQMNVMDLLPAFNVDLNYVKPALENTLSGELSKIEEWKITNKKGQELILSARPTQMKKGDEIIGISVVLDDITDRKKAAEAIKEKTAKLERFAKLSVGREKKMKELKTRIKELEMSGGIKTHNKRGGLDE